MSQEVIAYTRRSQDKRGQKHSIERQEREIKRFAKSNDLIITNWFSETESGMNDDRIELAKAVSLSEKSGSPLIVSSASRLGRKLSKVALIVESPNMKVICCDLGMSASFLQIMIASLFAAEEKNLLSKRTAQGIAAARAKAEAEGRPFLIGNPVWDRVDCLPAAWEMNRARGTATAIRLGGLIHKMKEMGMSYPSIARELNSLRYQTPSGKGSWYQSSVYRIHKRFIKERNAWVHGQ